MFDKIDVALFFNYDKPIGKSIQYFSGVETDFAILLKYKRRQVLYISDLEEKPRGDFEVKKFDFEVILSDLKKAKVKTIGIHHNEVTVALLKFIKKRLKGFKFLNIGKEVNELRQVKTDTELKYIKKAVAITEEIIEAVAEKLATSTHELDVVKFIRQEMIRHNVVESFAPIVASGTNSRNPHYHPKPTSKLQKGFCIIDMGVKYKGYCSDITRTFYLGKPRQDDIDFYNKIKRQSLKFEKMIKVGDKNIKADFEMIHLVGHGIGLDVHESPGIGYDELKEGVCLAIEPALYTTTFGVRIEDDYYLSKNGLKRLNKSSRDLRII